MAIFIFLALTAGKLSRGLKVARRKLQNPKIDMCENADNSSYGIKLGIGQWWLNN